MKKIILLLVMMSLLVGCSSDSKIINPPPSAEFISFTVDGETISAVGDEFLIKGLDTLYFPFGSNGLSVVGGTISRKNATEFYTFVFFYEILSREVPQTLSIVFENTNDDYAGQVIGIVGYVYSVNKGFLPNHVTGTMTLTEITIDYLSGTFELQQVGNIEETDSEVVIQTDVTMNITNGKFRLKRYGDNL